jgi:hypothetical protein
LHWIAKHIARDVATQGELCVHIIMYNKTCHRLKKVDGKNLLGPIVSFAVL